MKTKLLLLLSATALILNACSSGKKALERGDYDEAVYKSINRLKQNPDHRKSTETLSEGYPLTIEWHLDNIMLAQNSTDPFKYEKMADEYNAINNIYKAIGTCPACKKIVPNPHYYATEYDEMRKKGAEVRYNLGETTLAEAIPVRDRAKAKEAYFHFYNCSRLDPGYSDVANKMDEAKYHATLKVVIHPVPVHSRSLELSNEFFNNKIHEFLLSLPPNEFVRFYTPDEAHKLGVERGDEEIRLKFDDFVVGQVYHKETVVTAEKDSILEVVTLENGEQANTYKTATAKVTVERKELTSTGLLDFQIVDPYTGKVFTQEKFPGTYVWFTEWGNFNGEEVALTEEQLNICAAKEVPPPAPQDLFMAFTQPIFDQVTTKIRAWYSRY